MRRNKVNVLPTVLRRLPMALVTLTVAFALAQVQPPLASACSIDGIPSALANGHRAAISHDSITATTLRTWAYFTFAGRYPARTPVRFTEDRRSLHRVLAPDALAHALRWDFGDGMGADGWTVAHRYSRPGAYRLSIAAYDAGWHRYFPFDSVRIIIAR